jgi:hypothetical protein
LSYITGDIVSRVQQRVRDTGYSSTEIKSYLNDTQNDVFNEYRLPFMEATQGYTFTIGNSDITNGTGLPTNYVQAIDLFLTTSSQERVIPYRDIRQIDEYNADPDDTVAHPPGVPKEWYLYALTPRVAPVPNLAYTAILRYYKKPTLLSGDGDIPSLPSEFEELLVVGAAYRVLQAKDNYDQAGVLQNKYDELLAKLVVKYSKAQVGTPTRMRINKRVIRKAHF